MSMALLFSTVAIFQAAKMTYVNEAKKPFIEPCGPTAKRGEMAAHEVKAAGQLFRACDTDLRPGPPIPMGGLILRGTIDRLVEYAMNDENGEVWRYTIVTDDGAALTAYQIELLARALGIRPI
ncbi:hypothetical protein WBP07_22675 (plasmid) [Novosphingobium sp. BL-8A]|uniref:hypothetical protein n=1 Tax=Novosphingobium sp. BL-8A TaxID=3127639 RepID=UPI003756A794